MLTWTLVREDSSEDIAAVFVDYHPWPHFAAAPGSQGSLACPCVGGTIPMSQNKGLDMHTVTVWAATCNEHRARSPPRAAGTPADTTCKAEQKPLLLPGKVWQTSCSSGCNAAPPGPAGRADLLQGGRPGWQAAHLRADRCSGAFGTGCWLQPCLQRAAACCAPRWCTAALS